MAISGKQSITALAGAWGPRLFPALHWLGELRDRQALRADVIAGITVALVLIPQSMAYAQLAGLPTYYGLYAAFLPPMMAALFGSSRQLATGPVAMVSLLTAAALQPIATQGGDAYIAYAILLALMVGVFQLALGMLRLGVLVNFISHPVVMGFTNAAAIIIATSQLGKIFGVSVEKAELHYETVWNTLVVAATDTHWPTLGMAVLAFTIMIVLKRVNPKLPGVLIAVVVTTLISWGIGFEAGGKVVAKIPEGLPSFRLPHIDLETVLQLSGSAVAIALIGFMEAIAIAKAMAARTRQRLDVNQELVGQGLANITGSFFQSYAVSGSFSRSAVNIGAGAITGFSSVMTGLVVVVTLMWLTPLLYYLPLATLAAVIMMAVIGLVNIKALMHVWQVQRQDGAVALVTFVLTLALAPHLDQAIVIGVILSLVLYLYQTMKPRVAILSRHDDGSLRDAEVYSLETCPNISVIRFDGSLYFANTSYFEDRVLERLAQKPELKYVIVDGQGINEIDATGEEMLASLVERLEKSGVVIVFARLKKQVMDLLRKSGFLDRFGRDRFFGRTEMALDHAWKALGDDHEVDCPLNIVCPVDKPK